MSQKDPVARFLQAKGIVEFEVTKSRQTCASSTGGQDKLNEGQEVGAQLEMLEVDELEEQRPNPIDLLRFFELDFDEIERYDQASQSKVRLARTRKRLELGERNEFDESVEGLSVQGEESARDRGSRGRVVSEGDVEDLEDEFVREEGDKVALVRRDESESAAGASEKGEGRMQDAPVVRETFL